MCSWESPFFLREGPAPASMPVCVGILRLQVGAFVCWTFCLRELAPARVLGLLETFLDPGGLPGLRQNTSSAGGGMSLGGEIGFPSRRRAGVLLGLVSRSRSGGIPGGVGDPNRRTAEVVSGLFV